MNTGDTDTQSKEAYYVKVFQSLPPKTALFIFWKPCVTKIPLHTSLSLAVLTPQLPVHPSFVKADYVIYAFAPFFPF